ncbi:hypothetical protein F4809DRAFT_663659 [Biscogniauxia mediterranea]|nr:hypothetical protein F4809DRAFT_663659 [Biscogniauxia mediterranea]
MSSPWNADLEGKLRPAGAGTDPVPISLPATAGDLPGSETNSSVASLGGFSTGLRVDADDDDSDLDMFNVERMSSSMSASSGVYSFVEEHGRTYHRYKEGRYWMPNDEKEQQRLELQHMICLKVFREQLALTLVQNPTRVLDFGIGTGTRTWAIEFAIENPGSDVLEVYT